jgi:hypothetical protein
MAKQRLTRAVGDYVRTFASEDGKNYRLEHQELGPAMRRSQLIREAQAHHGTGQFDRRYIGSVPTIVLWDWLKERGYTMDQWARNEGGTRCSFGEDPMEHCLHDNGIKSQFLRYFLSRDFSKLHTQHTTTRPAGGEGKIWVPGHDNNLRRTENNDS